jgi:riboflavin biosynthesis pyrimidine reductase
MPANSTSWRDAFAALAAKKTAAAMSAPAAPYITVTANSNQDLRPIATPWSSSRFGGPFYVREPSGPRFPTCSLVFVRSADGNTVSDDPASLGGGVTDYHVVYEGLSRVAADGVLVGARTVHGPDTIFSVWHPEMVDLRQTWGLARHPTQIVATRRGVDLDRGLLFNAPDVPVILLTASETAIAMEKSLAARPWIRLVILKDRTDLPRAFSALRAAGIRRISCVGGRSLAADLLALKLVDDLYLTTSARRGGSPDTPLPVEAFDGVLVLEKHGTGEDLGVVFQHFDLQHSREQPRTEENVERATGI